MALRLLHAAGHRCTAFYLKIWFQEDYENFWASCPWEDDLAVAEQVCAQVSRNLDTQAGRKEQSRWVGGASEWAGRLVGG